MALPRTAGWSHSQWWCRSEVWSPPFSVSSVDTATAYIGDAGRSNTNEDGKSGGDDMATASGGGGEGGGGDGGGREASV